MRERIGQSKKATTGFSSIPSLKQPTRGFGSNSSNSSPQAATEVEALNKPLTHDISRISLRSQAKLSISQPGDIYEQEADSVAQQVVQRIAQPGNRQSIQREALPEDEEELQMKPLASSITPLVQRQEMLEDEEELQMKPLDNSILQRQEEESEEELQMKPMVQRQAEAEMADAPDLETSINQARGGGQVMADNIREPMEQAFGADFSSVKVHTDGQSDQLNRSIQARAFTTGQDVFFRQGEYNPGSRGGQELLAHELTHVVQQNGGAVMRSPRPLVPYPQQPSMAVDQWASASVGERANGGTINPKATAETGNTMDMKPSNVPAIKNNQGSKEGEIVVHRAERRVTTFDKNKGTKKWEASMEIIDSDDPNHYVHLSRSTVKNENVIEESKAKAQGLKPVEGKNAKSTKTETVEPGAAPFDRTNYTETNNVHITLEGRYREVLSRVAQHGYGSEDVKGGPPVTDHQNLNYGRGNPLNPMTIQDRIVAEAKAAKDQAKANMQVQSEAQYKKMKADHKTKKLNKEAANAEIDSLRTDYLKMHEERQNKITEIEQGTLDLTNQLIQSVPALTNMQADGKLVQYNGTWPDR